MNNTSNNSPTILAPGPSSSPNTSFNYQNYSPISSNSPHSSNLCKSRCKRRNSESENSIKKVKNSSPNSSMINNNDIPIDQLNLQNINLEEYPKFNHPEGGIIQFTPIGNIRTFVSDNNVVHRTIEKESSFDLNKTDKGIDGYTIYLGHNSALPVSLDSSPSNEIESYMRNGYRELAYKQPTTYYHNPVGCSGGCCTGNIDYDCDSDLDDDEMS